MRGMVATGKKRGDGCSGGRGGGWGSKIQAILRARYDTRVGTLCLREIGFLWAILGSYVREFGAVRWD